jgi:RHS repeat-associated protein
MKKLTVLLRVCAPVVDRVSGLVIAGLLGCLSLNALASITATTEYMYTEVLWGIPPTAWGTDRAALCASMGPQWNAKMNPGWTGYTQYDESSGSCDFYSVENATGVRRSGESLGFAYRYVCPAGSTVSSVGNPPQCHCNTSEGFQETSSSCVASVPEPSVADLLSGSQSGGQCQRPVAGASTPYPIFPATGEKYRSESDFVDSGPAPLSFVRTYRSNWSKDASRSAAVMGQVWAHNHNYTLSATPIGAPRDVTLTLPEGYVRLFGKAAGASGWTASNSIDTLTQLSSGAWSWKRADDDTVFNFNAAGKLQTQVARNGWTTSYTYDGSGRLSTVSNPFGRTLTLAYNSAGKLVSVTTPGGKTLGYSYDATGRLSVVTYPDAKTRSFVYENISFPQALTGIFDETNARWATFAYDAQGKAISTQLAGNAETYQVSYPSSGSATIIDPLGTSRTYRYGITLGKLAVTDGSYLPSGTGEADAASRVQDANGLVTRVRDFKGITTATDWDVARRLPISVTEALYEPGVRTTTTQWHATFSLPVLVTKVGRSTAFTYDAQGNKLSEAVTDTLVSPSTTKTRSWTYNPQGLVATETAPNGGVTSYTYDASGNVLTVVRPLSHVTSYTYDSANRVLSQTAPNGLVTTYAWDARDRLLTLTVGGQQTTQLTYNPTGTLATLALPTGQTFSYTYDAAHRLTGWRDRQGESGTFTLDAMGNRTVEQIKTSGGNIAWTTVRSVNAINRVSAATEGVNQSVSFAYDANGERITTANGLNQTTQFGLDGLRRVTTITDPANASATLAYNALDDVTAARDFKGVTTHYGRDARGNATVENSADTGQHVGAYDTLGLPKTIVDALGQSTAVTRDLLGRPTVITFADGKTTTLTYGTAGVNKGYLTSIADRSATTLYTRDAFGRVTLKKQTLANGAVQQLSYSYLANGLPGSVTYPGGAVLTYGYNAVGRIIQLNWGGQPLVTNIFWNPLGQPFKWGWAFADSDAATTLYALRAYDTAGRMTATEFSSYAYDAAGRITGLTQNLFGPADTVMTNSTVTNANTSWSVTNDPTGRVTGFNVITPATATNPANTAGFTYDANGNRKTSTRGIGTQSTNRTYALPSFDSNQATGFSQTVGNTTTSVNYAFNANRDLTSDGLNGFSYDAEGRFSNATVGRTDSSPTTRYAHNALGQRVFKTEPVYPAQGTTGSALEAFFAKGWTPSTVDAEKLGYAFVYDEDGMLLAETGMGGAGSGGNTQYVYLPTASGPMPVAAVINGVMYAVHSDHLNTPRRITSGSGQVMWQWAYSAFGETAPTTAAKRFAGPETVPTTGTTTATPVTFNLRYPGQYADSETGLFYNANRTYDPRTGRYTQPDPTGLIAGWNLFAYAELNPLLFTDPEGLETIYNVGPVSVVAYPGPPATDYRAEHGSKTGAGHHVHTFIGKHEGPRLLTGSFAVYPGDEKLCAGPFKDALDKLSEGEKQYIKRAQIQVFNDGKLGNRLQNRRLRLTLPRIMSGMPKGRE